MATSTHFFPDFPEFRKFFFSFPSKQPLNGKSSLAEQRLAERAKEISDIAKRIGYFNYDKITVTMAKTDPFRINASAKIKVEKDLVTGLYKSDDPGTIELMPFSLLNGEDFPQELRLSGPNDPRLKSEAFLNNVIDWSYQFLGLDKSTLRSQDRKLLHKDVQRCLKFYLNPDLAKRARQFIFAHEVAHLYYRHGVEGVNFIEEIKKNPFKKCGPIPAIAAFIVFVIIGLATSFSFAGLLLAGGVGAVTFAVAFMVNQKYLIATNQRKHEIQADLLAVKTLKDAEGAYHFLRNGKEYKGDYLSLFESHPNYSERIAIIKKHFDHSSHLIEQLA